MGSCYWTDFLDEMEASVKLTANDLALFTDLGEAPPEKVEHSKRTEFSFIRNGKSFKVVQHDNDQVELYIDDMGQQYPSAAALIASSPFADLRKWALNQKNYLTRQLATDTIQSAGRLMNVTNSTEKNGNFEVVSELLILGWKYRNCILVIDGPAGIGKTTFVSQLALERAESFSTHFNPLILHVESRGRVLQNITDLMAFSLQSLQVSVMYFQVPILVRLGLVTLAIDGFDELADPYGYKGAWSQLNDLVESTRGGGSLLLSGRETFISTERVLSSLPSIQTAADLLGRFSIEPLNETEARNWLKGQGWASHDFSQPKMKTLLQEGSIALRPFFLSKLADKRILASISSTDSGDPLGFLIDLMVDREVGKFGDQFESGLGRSKLYSFVHRFLEETARDLADNQATSLPTNNLEWIAEFVATEFFGEDVVRVLVQRCGSMALLSVAEGPSYRQFSHEQIQQHFLARNTVRSLSSGEVPKFVRRNILNHEFLLILTQHMNGLSQDEIKQFCDQVYLNQSRVGSADRARLNLVALLVAAVCGGDYQGDFKISDVGLDVVVFWGVVPDIKFDSTSFNSVYAQGADLRRVALSRTCSVYTAFFNYSTLPNTSWPFVSVIEFPDKTIVGEDKVASWLDQQRPAVEVRERVSPEALDLLDRICRYGLYWLREDDENMDRSARRILEHPLWSEMAELFVSNGLLEIDETRQASGRFSPFYHFRDKSRLEKMAQIDSTDLFLEVVAKTFPRGESE